MTRDLAIKLISGETLGTNREINEAVAMAVEALKQEPVKHGKWITNEYLYPICSVCGTNYEYEALEVDPTAWNYCPCCGAKMEDNTRNNKRDTFSK